MAEQRHAWTTGNSLVVPVPPLIQTHLELREGGTVYWHTGSPWEAVLGRSDKRAGGRPAGKAHQRELEKALREIERLRLRLRAHDQATLHVGKSVGWSEAQKYYAKIEGDIAELRELVLNALTARAS